MVKRGYWFEATVRTVHQWPLASWASFPEAGTDAQNLIHRSPYLKSLPSLHLVLHFLTSLPRIMSPPITVPSSTPSQQPKPPTHVWFRLAFYTQSSPSEVRNIIFHVQPGKISTGQAEHRLAQMLRKTFHDPENPNRVCVGYLGVTGKDGAESFMDMEDLMLLLRLLAAGASTSGLEPMVPDLWGSGGNKLRVIWKVRKDAGKCESEIMPPSFGVETFGNFMDEDDELCFYA